MADKDTSENETPQDETLHSDVTDTVEPHEDIEDHEDEHTEGLASKTLKGLALLAVGGAAALWAGPKIAPVLPSGMAPVAEWLTPGLTQAEQKIAMLETEVAERLDAIPQGITQAEVEAMIAQALGGATTDIDAKITALSDQLSATDSSDIESRIAALETEVGGLRAELSSLTQQISEATLTGGEINADTLSQIATYKAALDGLKAEVAQLAAQNGTLAQKIDEVAATAERQVSEAAAQASAAQQTVAEQQRTSAVTSALDAIGIALAAGEPFGGALATLADAGIDVPEVLTENADGVATLSELRAGFPQAAHAAIRAAAEAKSGGGLVSTFGGFLKSQVATRALTPQEGDSANAIQSRAEAALKAGDLATALAELSALPAPSAEMDAWIARAETRLKAETAYKALLAPQSE